MWQIYIVANLGMFFLHKYSCFVWWDRIPNCPVKVVEVCWVAKKPSEHLDPLLHQGQEVLWVIWTPPAYQGECAAARSTSSEAVLRAGCCLKLGNFLSKCSNFVSKLINAPEGCYIRWNLWLNRHYTWCLRVLSGSIHINWNCEKFEVSNIPILHCQGSWSCTEATKRSCGWFGPPLLYQGGVCSSKKHVKSDSSTSWVLSKTW